MFEAIVFWLYMLVQQGGAFLMGMDVEGLEVVVWGLDVHIGHFMCLYCVHINQSCLQ